MVQATDLRLGNLVMYDNRIFKIDCLHKDYPFLDTTEFGYGVVEYRNLQPIPITAEFFKERGFKIVDNYPYLVELDEEYKIITANGEGWYLEDDSFLQIWVNSIHDLQNAYYALTKTELEL